MLERKNRASALCKRPHVKKAKCISNKRFSERHIREEAEQRLWVVLSTVGTTIYYSVFKPARFTQTKEGMTKLTVAASFHSQPKSDILLHLASGFVCPLVLWHAEDTSPEGTQDVM